MFQSQPLMTKTLAKDNRSEQLFEKAIELVETLNMPMGTAANHLISYEFKLSDLPPCLSEVHLHEQLNR